MAADYFIHLECTPKRSLGDGDAVVGTATLLDLLKARHQAVLIQEAARRDGHSPSGISLTVRTTGPDRRPVEKTVTFEELVSKSAPLESHASACEGCPANLFSAPFGCYGIVPYPITRAAEEWLMGRVQPTSMVGGFLCNHTVEDFGYTGEPIRKMRAAGLLESSKAVTKVIEGGWLSKKTLTSDQILQGILAVGDVVDPGHCMGVLLWLGCLQLDGKPLGDASDAPLVQVLSRLETPEARRSRATLDVTPPPEDRSTASLQGLLSAFHLAWILDVPILMSY
jgi:hypothetical protein